MQKYIIAALYKFVALDDLERIKTPLLQFCQAHDVKGTLLLAHEGINGTISGSREGVDAALGYLRSDSRFSDLTHKESYAFESPFHRMKVSLKKEIVTLGVPAVDPTQVVGTYVKPKDWNTLIERPDVVLIDTRNQYEVKIGTFKGAIDPQTHSFREFPQWVASQESELRERPKVAMFCTGGIRCEKATSFLKERGFDEVYHLEGGILKYLEEIDDKESLWEGECFVFDERVSVKHGLEPGDYDLCHGCRSPIDEDDMASELYMPGVSCPYCHDQLSQDQRVRFAERHKQMQLAKARNEVHLGKRYEDKPPKASTSLVKEETPMDSPHEEERS